MKTLRCQIEINASADKVWSVLWDEGTYLLWTKFFSQYTVFETDWEVGGETRFLDVARQNGKFATIERIEKPINIIFKYLGSISNGSNDVDILKIKEWNGESHEYILEENKGRTRVMVIVETEESNYDLYKSGFQKGLEVVKEISEK